MISLGEFYERKNKGNELPLAPPAVDRVVFRGVLGKLVLAAEPTTEADPVGVLVSLMANAGALIGAGPYVQIGNTRHPLIVWPLLFGRTGAGRKGDATETADRLTLAAMLEVEHLFVSGLSSGEGLIERIRDPRDENDPGGTEDKRLRILEAEFGSVMARAKREGNTIGAVAREGWSGKALAVMNRLAAGLVLARRHHRPRHAPGVPAQAGRNRDGRRHLQPLPARLRRALQTDPAAGGNRTRTPRGAGCPAA